MFESSDVCGVELLGALKNVIAIGTGMADQLCRGDNAKALLVTRGLSEMMRLVLALGAEPATTAGLAGIGDRVHGNTYPWRVAKRGWTPNLIEVVAGALNWKSQYGKLAPLAQWMWRHSLGSQLDRTLREQVFTDWAGIDYFVDAFHELATKQLGLSSSHATHDVGEA